MLENYEAWERIGVPAMLIVLMTSVITPVIWWVARRLVGEDGVLTRVAESHMQFVNKTDARMGAMEECASAAREDIESLKRIALYDTECLEKIAGKIGAEISAPVEAIRRELSSK